MSVPTDPRTPQQRVNDQLTAAHRQLIKPGLSGRERVRVADRIHDLTQEAERISA